MIISCVFSINIDKKTTTNKCFLFNPPNPIKKFFYRCQRYFILDDLLKLYEKCNDNYAIVLISGKRTDFYLYNSNNTKFLKSIDESLPNQHKTGGQSAPRFGRIRDEKIGWYAKKICELMKYFYLTNGKFQHKGLIIAGPAEMKDLVRRHEIFEQDFVKYLLKILTIGEISDRSIDEVINLSMDVLSFEAVEQEIIQSFQKILNDPAKIDLIVFGEKQVITLYQEGRLERIYVAKNCIHEKNILKNHTHKTKIHFMTSPEFINTYGKLVGIMYYLESTEREIEPDVIEI